MIAKLKRQSWKTILALVIALALALAFRLYVAHALANDDPDDGKLYALLARNTLEQRVYSADTEPPYTPTLIRIPGYPLFLAAVYAVAGHGNNAAVRLTQGLMDTATCLLVALLAWHWETDEKRRRKTSAAAFAFAAICPFTTIYVATILTETLTTFLAVAMALTATLAFKARSRRASFAWWIFTGTLAGTVVLVRADGGLYAAGIGLTLVITDLLAHGGAGKRETARQRTAKSEQPHQQTEKKREQAAAVEGQQPVEVAERQTPALKFINRFWSTVLRGAVFSLAFIAVLAPWTIRNERVFHLFQPLQPAHSEMPGEFVPHGYNRWLRTWIDDGRYIAPLLWDLDTKRITIDEIPDSAFDSEAERERVAALLDQYNNPPQSEPEAQADANNEDNEADSGDQTSADDSSGNGDESDNGDEDGNQADNNDSNADEETQDEEQANVQMTPEIDAGFAQIADERIRRKPFRYYAWLPVKRAAALWFDTHSQYYWFEGELFPLDELDHSIYQQWWLPLFAALTWVYTLLGITGAVMLWRTRTMTARRWLLLAVLMTLPRLAFFSTIENPEPRYVVELFPFLAVLGGIAVARLLDAFHKKSGVINLKSEVKS